MEDSSTDEEPTFSSCQSSESRSSDGAKDCPHVQLLQYELMKAQLNVQGYLTTITSLQCTLRAMERTIMKLRAGGLREYSKSEEIDKSIVADRLSITPCVDVDCIVKPRREDPTSSKFDIVLETTNIDNNRLDSSDFTSANEKGTPTTTDLSSKLSEEKSIFGTTPAPDAPTPLYKGTCTSFLSRSYFSPSSSSRVFAYDNEKSGGAWEELPECPNTYFSLVAVNGLITAVGGWAGGDRKRPTESLLSLLPTSPRRCQDEFESGSKNEILSDCCVPLLTWREHFPPMPTKRGYPAAVSHNHSLIVAGGDTTWLKDTFLATVEILDTITLQWSIISSLPRPLRGATATICLNQDSKGGTLYLLGGWDKNGSDVFACSLDNLLSTAVPNDHNSEQFFLPEVVAPPCSCCWKTIAAAPHAESSCVSLGNKLFVFGGRGVTGGGSEDVHAYCEETNQWQHIGRMLVGRTHPLVAGLTDGCRAVIVGGMTTGPHITSSCEVAMLIPYDVDQNN